MSELAPLIAIVGPDGSGKSTLMPDVATHLSASRTVASGYLGLGSSSIGKKIRDWPLIGPSFSAFLNRRADQARDPNAAIPGIGAALVLYRLSVQRKKRFDRLLTLRRQGTTIVTDRYPQTEVPGYYDGPGLSAARAEGAIIRWLASKERALYAEMAAYLPTLVVRLNIDADTALARSPDHARALVEQKVAVTPKLRFNGAPIVEIDARLPYGDVRQQVIAQIEQALAGR